NPVIVEGQVMGYAYATLEPRDYSVLLDACGKLHDIYVDAGARGAGLGEALLQGRLLIPYWRGPEGQGINLGRMFDDPAPISITGWFQGWAAVPYLDQGPTVTPTSLRQFEGLMGGNAGLMMVFLN
ncbi:MAG: GNAT family N-acetyltransferase, partial [Pseudomonadota bacterium]